MDKIVKHLPTVLVVATILLIIIVIANTVSLENNGIKIEFGDQLMFITDFEFGLNR